MDERGLTCADLARAIGCAESTILQWTRGVYLPRIDYLIPLCRALDCSADELLGLDFKAPINLNRALSKELYQSITKKGKYNSTIIHQMATGIRRAKGKLTEFECWLRDIAEAVYKVEIMIKPKTIDFEVIVQLNIFDEP